MYQSDYVCFVLTIKVFFVFIGIRNKLSSSFMTLGFRFSKGVGSVPHLFNSSFRQTMIVLLVWKAIIKADKGSQIFYDGYDSLCDLYLLHFY